MNFRQVFLYCVLAILGMFIWKTWVQEHKKNVNDQPPGVVSSALTGSKDTSSPDYIPSSFQQEGTDRNTQKKADNSFSNTTTSQSLDKKPSLIYAKTDLLNVGFSVKGGNVVYLQLLKYPTSLTEKNVPLVLLSSQPDEFYITQSGLTSVDDQNIKFVSAKKNYSLSEGKNDILVTLTGKTKQGLSVTKTYRLEKNKYTLELTQRLINRSSRNWKGSFYTQIKRKKPVSNGGGGLFRGRVYDGAAISSPEKHYKKIPYKTMNETNLSQNIQDGWIAMQQRYFVNALIPPLGKTMHYYSREYNNDIYTIGAVSPEVNLAPGARASFTMKYFIGPKINSQLKAAAKGLDLTINYGWLWIISDTIFWTMDKINLLIGNWGWTIVLITILIKLLFYPLSAASFRSMGKMHQMQPRIQALKERYGDDKKALSQATMELYKKEKINPLGGCLPMLIQIPVFIALYYVLIESVQLRQAPFIFWIHDLSAKDPYYILPILMGISMFLTQKLSSVSVDPNQAKMMMILPIVFTVLFANFPAGLVLYWLVNNCVQGLQQWYVMKKLKKTPH